ncbi:hypothetical protein ABPG72_017195 [Tetrahymena utriculariae]
MDIEELDFQVKNYTNFIVQYYQNQYRNLIRPILLMMISFKAYQDQKIKAKDSQQMTSFLRIKQLEMCLSKTFIRRQNKKLLTENRPNKW